MYFAKFRKSPFPCPSRSIASPFPGNRDEKTGGRGESVDSDPQLLPCGRSG